jgi:hypothetical protein
VIVFKGLAWSVSLACFRRGPVFPALFLGAAGGLLTFATFLTAQSGAGATPLIIVGVVVADVTTRVLPNAAGRVPTPAAPEPTYA